jgi:hypothetical protein
MVSSIVRDGGSACGLALTVDDAGSYSQGKEGARGSCPGFEWEEDGSGGVRQGELPSSVSRGVRDQVHGVITR